jgi:hypothetical protein
MAISTKPGIEKPSSVTATPTKKTKKVATKSKEIKYSDKSEGQPELVVIFDKIKAIMKPFVKGTIKERGEKPGMYNLVSEKPFELDGRKFEEIYFASIIVQKGFVGFYYMPVYCYNPLKAQLKPELLKCLKGKTCFHIKKSDLLLFQQIREALDLGYESYQKRGWV